METLFGVVLLVGWAVASLWCFVRGLDALEPEAGPLPRLWKLRVCAWFLPGAALVLCIIAAKVAVHEEGKRCREELHGVWVENQCVKGAFEVVK